MSLSTLSALLFYFKYPQEMESIEDGNKVLNDPAMSGKLTSICEAADEEWKLFAKILEDNLKERLKEKLSAVGWKSLGSWFRPRYWDRIMYISQKGQKSHPRDCGIGFCAANDPELGSRKFVIATYLYFSMTSDEERALANDINSLSEFRDIQVASASSLPIVTDEDGDGECDWDRCVVLGLIDILSLPGAESFSVDVNAAKEAILASIDRMSVSALEVFTRHADLTPE